MMNSSNMFGKNGKVDPLSNPDYFSTSGVVRVPKKSDSERLNRSDRKLLLEFWDTAGGARTELKGRYDNEMKSIRRRRNRPSFEIWIPRAGTAPLTMKELLIQKGPPKVMTVYDSVRLNGLMFRTVDADDMQMDGSQMSGISLQWEDEQTGRTGRDFGLIQRIGKSSESSDGSDPMFLVKAKFFKVVKQGMYASTLTIVCMLMPYVV
jgi:hypothetical protein